MGDIIPVIAVPLVFLGIGCVAVLVMFTQFIPSICMHNIYSPETVVLEGR